jgi:chaperone BCS1
MSIYVVNLAEMNDRTLKNAMNWVPENSVILFEDIDCMKTATSRVGVGRGQVQPGEGVNTAIATKSSDQGGVSLSGLLNVLDGFSAPANLIYVMTTTDADAIDPVLMRPGRIDYKLFLGPACESQKVALYRRFFPDASERDAREFAQAHRADTMAEFQGLLLALEEECGTGDVISMRR